MSKRYRHKAPEVEAFAPLKAKSDRQAEYLTALREGVKLILATGHAGTGKSFLAANHAATEVVAKRVRKIVVARPYVSMGKDAGALPGTEYEKLYPFVRNILDTIKKYLPNGKFEYMIKNGDIEVQPIEKIRGRSFDESVIVIVDECQNTTPDQIKSIVTRIGEGCQMILCGDPKQKDIRGQDGLTFLENIISKYNIADTSIIHFTEEDIVRSGMVRELIIAFEKDYEYRK